MKKILLLVTLFFTLASIAQNKKTTQTGKLAGLDEALQKILTDWKGAGAAVAVVEKNKLIYAKGFGVKDINTKEPVTPNTLFAIGSCTKSFTATLVGQLIADGRFTYDEPVRNYYPALQFYNNDMNNLVSMRDMMCHRTGLPRHDLSWYFNQSENRDSLIARIKYMEPTYKPKELYQYNNFMFLAQGMVVEKMTGKSWETNMREKLLKPLNMVRSNMPYEAVKSDKDLASPHSFKNDSTLKIVPHYNIAGMGPAGALYSSVTEMANWVTAWIHGGKAGSTQLIPARHFKEATTGQVTMNRGIPDNERSDISGGDYGFGWMLNTYRGHYQVEHGGAIDGFIASTAFFPNDSIGIIVLTNQDNREITTIMSRSIADKILGLAPIDWSGKNLAARAKRNKEMAAATAGAKPTRSSATMSHPIAEYAGLYNHPGYGTYDLTVKNDSLFMTTKKLTLWLMNWHYDFFTPFEVDENGQIDTTEKSNMLFRFNTGVGGEIE